MIKALTITAILVGSLSCTLFAVAQKLPVQNAIVGQAIKPILVMVPWGAIYEAAIRLSNEPASTKFKSASLLNINGIAKLIVAESQVNSQVMKEQKATYGTITMKTDVISRVTYAVNLKDSEVRFDKNKNAIVVSFPPVEVDSVEHKEYKSDVSFTRLRKWFSSDTRAALEATTRDSVNSNVNNEAKNSLKEVREKYLQAIRLAAKEQLKDLPSNIQLVFEYK